MSAIHLCIDLHVDEPARLSWWGNKLPYGMGTYWQKILSEATETCRQFKTFNVPTAHVACLNLSTLAHASASFDFGKLSDIRECNPHHYRSFTNHYALQLDDVDLIAIKPDYSIASCLPLMEYMKHNDIRDVYLSGVYEALEFPIGNRKCISRSGQDLYALGYNVSIVAEGTNADICGFGGKQVLEERKRIHFPSGVDVKPRNDIMLECANAHLGGKGPALPQLSRAARACGNLSL